MEFFIDKCIKEYNSFLADIRNLNQTYGEGNDVEREIHRHQLEESFAMSFFVHMNNALFAGEYLGSNYDDKLAAFDNALAQDDSLFSLQIKEAVDHIKTLKTLINNKINLIGEDLLFSAIKSTNSSNDTNEFLYKFSAISIKLAITDHFLICQSRDDIATLVFMSDALEQEKTITNEDIRVVYEKLQSKCNLLLKKICYSTNDSHKYALDFKIYDIDERQTSDVYNQEFEDLFDGVYKKRNISNIARFYQNEFKRNRFSTKGFIVLSHYYRTDTKDVSQIKNLITCFYTYYRIQKKNSNLSDFDRYALECVRHYLHNSQFALNIEQPKYTIEQLEKDIDKIRNIQGITQIWNYHPYYKALEFLSKLIQTNEIIKADNTYAKIEDIIKLHKTLLLSYKKCLDWCEHRRFYPIQIEQKDCLSSEGVFCASTFAAPLNIKDLKASYRTYEGDQQVLIMQSHYVNSKNELNEIQQKIKSYRKETFEYIGVFIAIITFLFGSLQIFGTKQDWAQSIISAVSLGIVLCIFGAILSISLNEKIKTKCKLILYALIIIISILVLIYHSDILPIAG